MEMRAIFRILLGAVVLLSACAKDINLDLKGTPPVLVVNGWVTNAPMAKLVAEKSDSGLLLQQGPTGPLTYNTGFVVKLTTTASYYASDSTPPVSGAIVIISGSDSPSDRDTLKETPIGSGIYLGGPSNLGKAGVTYSLLIQSNGQVYTAQDQLDSIPKIDSASYALNTGPGDKTKYLITYHTHNILGPHYYLFKYYRNDTLLNSTTTIIIVSTQYFINPNDPELPVQSPYKYNIKDVSYLELYSLSQTTFTYYEQLRQQLSTSGPGGGFAVVFGTIPANVQGNMSNGAQGFFQASMYWAQADTVK